MLRKLHFIAIVMFVVVLLPGCVRTGYELPQSNDQIESVQLVDTADHNRRVPKSLDDLEITVLKTISPEEYEEFLGSFNKLEYQRIWNDPIYNVSGMGILITYVDNTQIIIGREASFYDQGERVTSDCLILGYEFYTFLESYLD